MPVISQIVANGDIIRVIVHDDDIIVNGDIEKNTKVRIVSRRGSVTIKEKIQQGCEVEIIAFESVTIGKENEGLGRIENNCNIKIEAGKDVKIIERIYNNSSILIKTKGDLLVGGGIHNDCNIDFKSGGNIVIADGINSNCKVEFLAKLNIIIEGPINNNSAITLNSSGGAIIINSYINNDVVLIGNAFREIIMNTDNPPVGINNHCKVFLKSNEQIIIKGDIDEFCYIELLACNDITVAGSINKKNQVFLKTKNGKIEIERIRGTSVVGDLLGYSIEVGTWDIEAKNTVVTYCGGTLSEINQRENEPIVQENEWTESYIDCKNKLINGHWWQNWSWKYGYVIENKITPSSLWELVAFFMENNQQEKHSKAIGGGWSFTDASLPFNEVDDVNRVSIEKRGIGGKQVIKGLLQGANDNNDIGDFDHQPSNLLREKKNSTEWNQDRLTNFVSSGYHLPGVDNIYSIIDTKRLASSLQSNLKEICSNDLKDEMNKDRHFFHVESGITMKNLNILLDHQRPRLAIQASGGSPGATLAGTISTATHGGEYKWPLLVDRVKAIHLVGPGGIEWWIEGSESIADFDNLKKTYPRLNKEHFITKEWKNNRRLKGFNSQDVLNAVIVSMGTIGVIYSIVIEVVEAYGIRQKIKRYDNWQSLLSKAHVNEDRLREMNRADNLGLLNFLMDGSDNGTGILSSNNVYIDLAINPINLECWIINRSKTGEIPHDSKDLDLSLDRFIKSFRERSNVSDAGFAGLNIDPTVDRLLDFLNIERAVLKLGSSISHLSKVLSFITNSPPLLGTALSTINSQFLLNSAINSEEPRREEFIGDMLSGLLDVLMGTVDDGTSDITGLSYKVGAIGWTEEGISGKGCEISLPAEYAFSFLQTELIDMLKSEYHNSGKSPLIGYLSLRVCPNTDTLMGMQQFGNYSIMIEPVGFRTPDSIELFNNIQNRLFAFNERHDTGGMLHWGLENDQLTKEHLDKMAVNRLFKSEIPLTRLEAFKAIKKYIQGENSGIFDNYFVKRLGLDNFEYENREVSSVKRKNGVIIELCGNEDTSWSPVTVENAIEDIRSLRIGYFIFDANDNAQNYLQIINHPDKPYLRTEANSTESDNLAELPECII